MEGRGHNRPATPRPNYSDEEEEEQQLLVQENAEQDDSRNVSSTSADESGLYDEAVGGPSASRPLLPARAVNPDSTGQNRERSIVAQSALIASWHRVIESAREAQRQQELMRELFNLLKQTREMITADLYLRFGQRIMLASASFQSYRESLTSPRENFLAVAVSYTQGTNHASWVNDSVVTAVIDTAPRNRSIFCIRSVLGVGNYHIVNYGQLVFFELVTDAAPHYLEGYYDAALQMYKLRLTKTFSSACYFYILHRMQLKEEVDVIEMPFRVAFLLQHERSGLFLSIDCQQCVSTVYGLEYVVKLQPIEVSGNSIVPSNYFFKSYVS